MINLQNAFEKFKQYLDLIGLEEIYLSPDTEMIRSRCKKPIGSCPQKEMALHQHQNKETLEVAAEGRERVETTAQWPSSVHGIVSFKLKGIHCWGTGTLIGPNIVLTAGYNLFNHEEKAYSDLESMQFLPGVNGHLLPFGVIEVEQYFVSPNYIKDEKREDYGILILKEPIGNETGYFGLACLKPEELGSKRIHITGYPADKVGLKPNTYEMWGMEGEAYDVDQEQSEFSHCIETGPGQGGSGVWYQEGEDYYVCGIHLSGGQFANKATLLTRDIYVQIYQWIHEAQDDQSLLQFKNIKKLRFEDHQIDARSLALLTEYHFDQLTDLRLSSKKIKPAGAKALAKNISWINLSELNLSKNNISTEGVKELTKNTSWINLSKLYLQSNKIGPEGAQALAQNTSWIKLSKLDLSNNNINTEGAKALAQNTSWIKLSKLDLSDNNISTEGAKALAKNTSWINISKLCLQSNKIGPEGAKALAQNTSWVNLSKLCFQSNKVGPEGAQALAQNTSWVNLSELYLQSNQIGSEGAQALAQNTSWIKLSKLDLSDNNISTEGAKALAKNTPWIRLSKLYLKSNKIDIEDETFAQNPFWINLAELDLSRNRVSIGVKIEKGLKKLQKLFAYSFA